MMVREREEREMRVRESALEREESERERPTCSDALAPRLNSSRALAHASIYGLGRYLLGIA
jgi:hypothetical protein